MLILAPGLIILSALVLSAGLAVQEATAFEHKSDDRILGDRLVEGVATTESLWIRNSEGTVVQFTRSNGAREVLAKNLIIDMERIDGRLLGLGKVGETKNTYLVLDLTDHKPVSPPLVLEDSPIALLSGPRLTVLTPGVAFNLGTDGWQRKKLTEPLRKAPQISIASSRDGIIYLGYNHGEWGGGMQSLDPATGKVTEVDRIDGKELCDGPLNKDCDPVTGVIPDLTGPDCVLASIGLSHLFSMKGRILRVCGTKVEVVYRELLPESFDTMLPSTWPFFGLVSPRDGWAAVSYGQLFRSVGGKVIQNELPELQEWSDLHLAVVEPDLIILNTDVNWGSSTSGYTPLLVQVAD